MRTQRFVLDTSAFTGLSEPRAKIAQHIENLTAMIAKAKKRDVSCYVPPSVWEELRGLLVNKKIPKKTIDKLDAWTIQKSPSRLEIQVPAEFVYQYIIEVRERFSKGLREAEKAVVATHHKPEAHARVVGELREKYRKAIRHGMLDSREDLDVLFLAKELGAGIVATDEGIMRWAKKWGVRFTDARNFPRLLKEYSK